MNKLILVVLLTIAGVSTAYACGGSPPPNCSCKNGQWVNNTTNQVYNNTTNNTINNVDNSVKSDSTAVSNSNSNAVATGGSIATGAVQNTVAGGSSTATASNNGNNSGNSTASASANGAGSNNGNVNIEYRAAKIPVASAYAPSLTSGSDTCLGSMSGGAQTSFLGITIGGTKRDKNCEHIKNTHLITEFNQSAGCSYMLKHVEGASEAFKEVGAKCIPDLPEETFLTTPAPDLSKYATKDDVNRAFKQTISK